MATSAPQRDERINLRVSAELKTLLARAASYSGTSLASFLVSSASERAKEVVAEREILTLTARDCRTFLAGLDKPERRRPRLEAAAKRYAAPGTPPQRVALPRGVAPESRISRLFRDRAQRRLEIAQPRAEAAVKRLRQRGVKARIAGSLARGSFRHTSDVDLLIEQRGTLKEAAIEKIVRAEMGDFPFDLIYADRLRNGRMPR